LGRGHARRGGLSRRRWGKIARSRAGQGLRATDAFGSVDQHDKVVLGRRKRTVGWLFYGGYRPSQGLDFARAKLDEPARHLYVSVCSHMENASY
jgi:hypothetical protein